MIFKTGVPILYSTDVARSLHYYVDILGFDQKWEWDDPPTFGGVSKDAVEIFFCEKGQGHPGTWLSVFVDNIDEFYEAVRARGAKILIAPENREWGVREMLVEDPEGHKIRFGQNTHASGRERSAEELPQSIRITVRVPTAKETRHLASAVGWRSPAVEERTELPLAAIAFAVVAEDTVSGEVIGCAFLLGDQDGFYYVKNVIVHPDWQGRRVGTALMQELTNWLEKNAPDNAYVGLHTGENLASFYKQFGFAPAFGMSRRIRRH